MLEIGDRVTSDAVNEPIKKIYTVVSFRKECECGDREVELDRYNGYAPDQPTFWIHEKYVTLYKKANKMSDSLQKPTQVIDYFAELRKMNPTLYNLFERCVEKIVNKNHDYAGKDDFYRNFRKSESVDIPAWKGIFVRFQDKVSRIEGFIKTGVLKVSDESILDTCVDAANYILLMYACYADDRAPKTMKKAVDQRDAS